MGKSSGSAGALRAPAPSSTLPARPPAIPVAAFCKKSLREFSRIRESPSRSAGLRRPTSNLLRLVPKLFHPLARQLREALPFPASRGFHPRESLLEFSVRL